MPQGLSSLAAAAHSAVQCPHRLRGGLGLAEPDPGSVRGGVGGKLHDELAEPGSRSVEGARPAESAASSVPAVATCLSSPWQPQSSACDRNDIAHRRRNTVPACQTTAPKHCTDSPVANETPAPIGRAQRTVASATSSQGWRSPARAKARARAALAAL